MAWTIETLNEAVNAELEALSPSLRARLVRVFELIEAAGLESVREPHVRQLERKLWEIRARGADGIARAIYLTAAGQRVVIVHAFVKKTQKTPKAALELARRRAREVLK